MDLKQAKALARERMGDKRFEHTLNVKKQAVKMAKRFGEDPDRAALAALLHDTAKELPAAQMLELMRQHPELAGNAEHRPTPVWHGVCAAILARTEWGIADEDILNAIGNHTTGRPGMSRLEKIVFLADMSCAERNWPGVEELRELEMQDLDQGMKLGLRRTIDFVKECGKPLDPLSVAAYEDICARC